MYLQNNEDSIVEIYKMNKIIFNDRENKYKLRKRFFFYFVEINIS